MAVGRLVHLAATVTLPTSSSASVTVPNDGSVVVGDLLLVGCVMPSGSRTFAITGGAGSWTSLGSAAQSGHTSQLWWRLAAAGDLGATITVTPSSPNIRQVLLLGKISGVHATTPIAGSQSNTTTAAVKTTPTVGSIPAGSREVSVAWDSRGGTTPNTSTWAAPAGETRQGQAFTTDGSGSCSGAWGDSDATVSGTIGARDWTPDQPAIGSAWTVAVAEGATAQTLSPARIESTVVVHAPTLAAGGVTVAPGRIEPTAVVHAPVLAPGVVTLTPGRLEPATALHTPTLAPGPVTLAPARIEPTAVLHEPVLTSVAVLAPGRIESTAVILTLVLAAGGVTLQPGRIESGAVLYAPSISGGQLVDDDLNVTVTGPHTPWAAALRPGPWVAQLEAARWEVDGPWS